MLNISSPAILQKMFPGFTWKIAGHQNKNVYLTFDDGPVPGITPWVLSQLKSYNAKATFFCVGNNVKKNPAVYEQILNEGHTVGNHTFDHLKGWFNKTEDYIKDIEKASQYIKSNLFRPPHGMIRRKQRKIVAQKYKIIMWDVLSRDYNHKLSGQKCFSFVQKYSKPGSIIVFHDSYKAEKNLRYALPKVLEYLSNKGYRFSSIV